MPNGMATIDLICPSWNNEQYLVPFLNSILPLRGAYPFRLIIVNNGHPGLRQIIPDMECIKFVQAPDNLGWEGGLKLGLQHSDAEYVMFINDDVHIPTSSENWLRNMLSCFQYPGVGAVGPTSNCVMGSQAIWVNINRLYHKVPFLIGFCMLLKRSILDEVGGVDDTLPGGDDLDLSIRLRDKGYHLICDRRAFVYHHGFKTGTRVFGGAEQDGGWNSPQMSERTTLALIKKHGLKKWYATIAQPFYDSIERSDDSEGKLILSWIRGKRVLELGCGGQKTVPEAIGVDFYGKGELIPIINQRSVADVKSSVLDMPKTIGKFDTIIARHILEHTVDPLKTIKHWSEFLIPGGQLIIAVPDDRLVESIPMNPEHKHVFTAESLTTLCKAAGLVVEKVEDSSNGVSFTLMSKLPSEIKEGVLA